MNVTMFPDAQMIKVVLKKQILFIVLSIVTQVYLIIFSHVVIKIPAMTHLLSIA
jgi:hypothetical protein